MLSQTITVAAVGANQGFTALQTYTYDSLNRLDDANETVSGQTWRQDFSYDRYGNRNFVAGNTTTLGSCPAAQCNPTTNTSDNRFSTGSVSDDFVAAMSANGCKPMNRAFKTIENVTVPAVTT